MRKSDLQYDLPPERIAQYAAEPRDSARLLVLHRADGRLEDRHVTDLPEYCNLGDLLLSNNTRVVPARLLGHRVPTGGRVEIMLLQPDHRTEGPALVRAGTDQKAGLEVTLTPKGRPAIQVVAAMGDGSFWVKSLIGESLGEIARRWGHMPLPPYIRREDEPIDRERYQTIWAEHEGSVAAPTAGLHFTPALLRTLLEKGILRKQITLHVGWGTFRPVESEILEEHPMHAERYSVSPVVVDAIRTIKRHSCRVIVVGTTTIRAIETVFLHPDEPALTGETRLFIRPGFEFHVADALMTNFHAPGSTLLALVSAFAGQANIRAAYEHALKNDYRFLSYGDAMLIV